MYKQGEILLITLPFSNLKSSKQRPVLVISNDEYNIKSEDIIVAAITSNICRRDNSLIIDNNDLIEGSLRMDSCIRSDKLFTLSQTIVIKKFGKVRHSVINQVTNNIVELVSSNDTAYKI